jgi:hypothetical protein
MSIFLSSKEHGIGAMLDRDNIVDERDADTTGEKMAHYLEDKAKVSTARQKQREVTRHSRPSPADSADLRTS